MANKVFIRNIRPHVDLYQDRKTGIAWIEDCTAGIGISCHPNISDTGSIRSMRAKGWWDKKDRIVRSHGFYYNIDHLSGSGPDHEIVRATCDCGGYHGAGRAVGGGKKRHGGGGPRRPKVPRSWEVQPLRPGQAARDPMTCLTCGLSWDDAESTSMTPTPSGRCPFEAFHRHGGKRRHGVAPYAVHVWEPGSEVSYVTSRHGSKGKAVKMAQRVVARQGKTARVYDDVGRLKRLWASDVATAGGKKRHAGGKVFVVYRRRFNQAPWRVATYSTRDEANAHMVLDRSLFVVDEVATRANLSLVRTLATDVDKLLK